MGSWAPERRRRAAAVARLRPRAAGRPGPEVAWPSSRDATRSGPGQRGPEDAQSPWEEREQRRRAAPWRWRARKAARAEAAGAWCLPRGRPSPGTAGPRALALAARPAGGAARSRRRSAAAPAARAAPSARAVARAPRRPEAPARRRAARAARRAAAPCAWRAGTPEAPGRAGAWSSAPERRRPATLARRCWARDRAPPAAAERRRRRVERAPGLQLRNVADRQLWRGAAGLGIGHRRPRRSGDGERRERDERGWRVDAAGLRRERGDERRVG